MMHGQTQIKKGTHWKGNLLRAVTVGILSY